MPLPFLRRQRRPAPAPPPRITLAPDQLESEEQVIRYQYHSLSSHGVRLPETEHDAPLRLSSILQGFARSEIELIEPLPIEFQDAAPSIVRPEAALHWINVHHGRSPIARHALLIFESVDAIDLAYETFAVALLHGDVDGEGFPRYDAIVGGPVSYWDETSGDLIVRLLVGWGGTGVRGDTARAAQRLLARMMVDVMASQGATELGRVGRPVAIIDASHTACPHCGFGAVDRRATYCPKCGMRTPG
jgi:ribosomal protein L37E